MAISLGTGEMTEDNEPLIPPVDKNKTSTYTWSSNDDDIKLDYNPNPNSFLANDDYTYDDNDGGKNEAESDDEETTYDHKLANAEEETEMVKAREGYELVETVTAEDRRRVKVLYLTNKQAAHLVDDSRAMDRMIDSLCGGTKRYLIIDLVQSWGFHNSNKIMDEKKYEGKWCAGIKYDTPPFKNLKEEQETINQINHFMLNVIIPLAEKTSAIIVCNAIVQDCILCERFINIIESMSSRWGGNPPFAVVGILESVHSLYHNSHECARWKKIRNKSNTWKKRHMRVLKKHFKSVRKKHDYRHDLSWTTSKLVIIEGLDITVEDKEKGFYAIAKNTAPSNLFTTSLMKHFAKDVPQLAFKTGACTRDDHYLKTHYRGIQQMSYRTLLERINSGASVVCIDVRDRGVDNEESKVKEKEKIKSFGKDASKLEEWLTEKLQGEYEKRREKEDSVVRKVDNSDISTLVVREEKTQKGENVNSNNDSNEIVDSPENFDDSENLDGCESLDCCMLAYLKRLLDYYSEHNDGEVKEETKNLLGLVIQKVSPFRDEGDENEIRPYEVSAIKEGKTLQKAIQIQEEKERQKRHLTSPKNDQDEISTLEINYAKCAYIFAWSFFRNLPLPKDHGSKECKEEKNRDFFSSEIQTTSSFAMQLLMNENLHAINIWDRRIDQVAAIDKIVLKGHERKPSLEGLRLLRKAWGAIDNAREVGDFYQKLAERLYQIQLILGLALTVVSIIIGYGYMPQWRAAILCLSLSLGAIVSFETILSPQVYGNQLRSAQVELESTVWKYRMQVDEFRVDQTNPTQKKLEKNLRIALEEWGGDLVTSSKNTSATGIHGRWKVISPLHRIFMKKRRIVSSEEIGIIRGSASTEYDDQYDDHYSFLDGTSYIDLRIQTLIQRYQQRIPFGIFFQYFWHIFNILLGVAIAIITSEVEEEWGSALVAILTAFIAVNTAWIEFKDREKEANLLSSAIQELKNQEYKWTELTKFMAQSRDITQEVVIEVERIANLVVSSWSQSIMMGKSSKPIDNNNDDFVNAFDQGGKLQLRAGREEISIV